MWYVYDVLYAVVYVHVRCFLVFSRRYIDVCNGYVFNVVMCTMTI